MFRRSSAWRIEREYALRPAPEFLFERRPFKFECADRKPGQSEPPAPEVKAVLVVHPRAPYLLTSLEELRLDRADVPALTIAADPSNSIAVAGGKRHDWCLRFCAQGEGEKEAEARERLEQISITRVGSTVSLNGPAPSRHQGSGRLVIDAPSEAPIVIHASYAAAEIRDMAGPVRIAATHARVTILDTTGQVDATALSLDFAGARGRVTLSAEGEINLKIKVPRFQGTLLAWARRSVRMLVPAGFVTPFQVMVRRRRDFICRADLCSDVKRESKHGLYYFTYAGDGSAPPETVMHLRSEESTVVIDGPTQVERLR